jgi:hypothetical protein
MIRDRRINTLFKVIDIGKTKLLFIFQAIDCFLSFVEYRNDEYSTTIFFSIIKRINTRRKIKEYGRITFQVVFEITILIRNCNAVIGLALDGEENSARNAEYDYDGQQKRLNIPCV